ncbi:unnamed protein product [Sphagnum balticum]
MGVILPNYEEAFLRVHAEDEQLVVAGNEAFREKLQEYLRFCEVNPLNDYVEMISYDIREIRALIDAIDSRKAFEEKKNNYEVVRREAKAELEKIRSGKTTLKSLFSSGNKEQQAKDL